MSTETTKMERLDQAVKGWHAHGLDSRYDDILDRAHATGTDAGEMAQGSHYDYRAQRWNDGHDHAHTDSICMGPRIVGGRDTETCLGIR